MEILFPDVVGSGGAPKRITKPRRKGVETMPDSDDLDTPGTNVMNLLSPGSSSMPFPTSQTPIHPPMVPSNGTVRPSSTTLQNRSSIASTAALTPPDDEAPPNSHSRKRFHPSNTTSGSSEKRRRTENNNYIDLTHSAQLMNMDSNLHDGGSVLPNNHNQASHQSNNAGPSSGGPAGVSRTHLVQESMLTLSEFVRGFRNAPPPPPPTPRWTEQAMEIFFRDFSDEDPDLQIKIGEKVLCDTNKATMFCTMPEQLRQHWVKRLRELHHRLDVSAGLNSSMNSNAAAAINASAGLMNGGSGMAGMMQMGGPVNGGGMGRNGSQVG